ncbi:unnamed protein product [Plutella xylostella]|uniref:(diamondback moth) hypothetical protein n=1 Tax=Plutella xylostella TaxID=51655 RepID=A0A8S4ENS3_PLUXY|nr:unnamed protein product [Plutella xylostella]
MKSNISEANLLNLPLEILEKILLSTNGTTLVQLRAVCKYFLEIVDENALLWKKMCVEEFKLSSEIVRTKCGAQLEWCKIYRNLRMWNNLHEYPRNVIQLYDFSDATAENIHTLQPLVLKEKDRCYDSQYLRNIPVALPVKDVLRTASNSFVSVVLFTNHTLSIRSDAFQSKCDTETTFLAEGFSLSEHELYFYYKQHIMRVDLTMKEATAEVFLISDYKISYIRYSYGIVHIFTPCGKILSVNKEKQVSVKAINCPEEWIKRIKYVVMLDDCNYICYSRNLFQIEAEDYRHWYMDFPFVTAVFFYGDVILIATKEGKILLYYLSRQKRAQQPIFEEIAELPDSKFATSLDIYETITGPHIVATTNLEIFVIVINFFSELEDASKKEYDRKNIGSSLLGS